jgi:hypothetical protein
MQERPWRVRGQRNDADPAGFCTENDRLLAVPVEQVLVAHGDPVFHDGSARIAEAIGRA